MIVHVFRFVFSSTPTSDLTSQKPESLKCEHTVEPPATAATTHARYSGGSSDIPGIAAMIPAAMVIATVAEPTQIRTSAATIKATNLNIPLQSLSTKELDILQYVHDHSDNISSISIQQFANELNYSTSTILRFCRKLGFSGFSEFKYFLKSSDNEDNNKIKGSDKSLDIIKNTIKDSMDSTVSLLNSDDMFQIARLFSENRPIYLHSPAGLTDIAVSYLESMLFLSGCQKIYKTTAAKAAHHFIQTVDKGNVFVFISNSGRFEPTLNLAKEARLHGMIVISISSIENNDLAEVSDYNLRFFSKPREYEGADFTSRLGSFFVISSFMEYFNLQRKGDNSNEPSASD